MPKINMTELLADREKGTEGPWYVGCQNDALYIVAGRAPALNNDYPWHEAPRVCLAKVFGPSDGDCLPVNASFNASRIARIPDLEAAYIKAVEVLQEICGTSYIDTAHEWAAEALEAIHDQ